MARDFRTFLGVDLGGGKGKTTAVARLEREGDVLEVVEVGTTRDQQPWYDENLVEYLGLHAKQAVIAMDAPLTLTACVRCREPVCPGMTACVDPAVVWFRTAGAELIQKSMASDRDQIAAIPANGRNRRSPHAPVAPPSRKPQSTPYTQRATEVILHREHGIIPRETLGQGMGPLTARAAYLVRALQPLGYALHENLIEVYPKATLQMLWGRKVARAYKREAETWDVRARVLESLRGKLEFGSRSRLAREDVLRNDHNFDAVIAAYTGFLWATESWTLPARDADVFKVDGWIWCPGT